VSSASGSKKRRRAPVSIAGFVVAALLAGAVLFPATASAYSRGWKVYNLSGNNLKFYDENGIGNVESGPVSGGVRTPGLGYDDFEITYYFATNTIEIARYQIFDTFNTYAGVLSVTMTIDGVGQTGTDCEVSGIGVCDWNGSTITYMDPPGTAYDIPAGQGQAQAATLRQLCRDDSQAGCSFTPTRRVPVDSPTHGVGNALINPYDQEQETTVTISDTVGATDSLEIGVEAGAKLFDVVDFSVSAKYGHQWTSEHTFMQDISVTCPGHTKCWLTGDDPMWRDTGDYILTLGDTTWYLRNIYIDSPNPSGQGSYRINEAPVTASELARLPQAVIQTGTDGNDTILGTNVDDRINAKPGNDTVNARAGDDVLSGGSGNDHVKGGPGDDTINGGTGVDSLAGGSGDDRINARDGRTDRVDCGGGDDSAALDSKDKVAGATAQDPDGNCESVARN
jgi:hypothetical protein